MIGHWEIIAIIAIILLIFGPSKLPALGKSIGESFKNLKKGLKGEDEGEKSSASSIEKKESSEIKENKEK